MDKQHIALCFSVKNCAPWLEAIFNNIELLKTLNFNFSCVFIYDKSNDKSESMLRKYKKKNKNVFVKKIVNNSPFRTVRIAKARNECLDFVYNILDSVNFHIMIDCDNVCSNTWNIKIINNYLTNFDNDDWDCISFNKTGYYDIWALMYDDFKHHCWGFGNESHIVVENMRKDIINKLKNSESNSIEVLSAFNGFAIYRTERFKDLFYDGLYRNFKPLITDDERDKTLMFLKSKFNLDVNIDNNFIECCEHLFFHVSAKKQGRKIKVSRFIII